ncbi:MAG: hypothetical protein AAF799_16720 [Myxococcota bacterium]
MKKVVRNAAYQAYLDANETLDLGTRLKSVRDEPLTPGGRARMTLFERVSGGRPHPRMQFSFVEVEDPNPPGPLFTPDKAPTNATELRAAIGNTRSQHAETLALKDLEGKEPKQSRQYWRNRIRANRCAALFEEVRAKVAGWVDDGSIDAAQHNACKLAIAEQEDEAFAGRITYDNEDTKTYHSYKKDAPFVHYLEEILKSLPEEGSEAMAVSYSATRESIRRQREQARRHLDYLMRNKYAYEVIVETDIEKTLGGFLIDRASRRIVSETPDSDPLEPSYELLRIKPSAEHPHAGKWLYRTPQGTLHLQTHEKVEVDASLVRSTPRDIEELTFRRAPKDPNLRQGIRFDWDESGWVQQDRVDWVSWAGHCDLKAVVEALGVTLTWEPKPGIEEYRSDTGKKTNYNRDLLLEMVASILEFGSVHSYIDGTGRYSKGIHHFGGSRNDSHPDRLQFKGLSQGRSFRWPLGGRQDVFRISGIELPNGDKPDMGTVFFRHLPDTEKVSFAPNPRYIKTVEGDYNIIDVSGSKLEARIKVDVFDESTGYPIQKSETTTIDLRDNAEGGADRRDFLGTHIEDVATRKLFRVYYVPKDSSIVAEMHQYTEKDGKWVSSPLPDENTVVKLVEPLNCTLSREMKRDDPSQFTALLDIAQRQAKNICADTDKESAVWNGVVTSIDTQKLGANAEARTEHWKVDIKARFGDASLEYLVRRGEDGTPEAYCPATSDRHWGRWPDFLWQDIPDVCTKGLDEGEWVVNETMLEREFIEVRPDDSLASGFFVFDDHVKNVYELIWGGLAGYTHTIVHENKRYGFKSKETWQAAVDKVEALRQALSFK